MFTKHIQNLRSDLLNGTRLRQQQRHFMLCHQSLFGQTPLSDVAKTPDASQAFAAKPLGLGVSLEDATVLEMNQIIAVALVTRVQVFYFLQELLWFFHLVQHRSQELFGICRIYHRLLQPPHLSELFVRDRDAPIFVYHQQAVSGRL